MSNIAPTALPAPIPQPGTAMTKDLLATHLATSPHQGTGRGEALDLLALIISLNADELDTTAKSIHRGVEVARTRLDTLAAGGALSPVHDEPVMTKTGAGLDLLNVIAQTQTRHLCQLVHTYRQLNTATRDSN
ncbi:hypothetical protein C7C46_31875 [Streptomyces tateyamensis]|uniref:Uncharacterized protein n=1 Tax=Streptomyces tateyamensis TaxID=565073 RepID=A0A2V4N4T7_9ACTN|nr:hypothetical protein [Streptomyces tateyamensis]PYC66041.1 hypothetical protein C7C46_31875 [Streptomyces tateyamensis]